jgi:hypothetical protein
LPKAPEPGKINTFSTLLPETVNKVVTKLTDCRRSAKM